MSSVVKILRVKNKIESSWSDYLSGLHTATKLSQKSQVKMLQCDCKVLKNKVVSRDHWIWC